MSGSALTRATARALASGSERSILPRADGLVDRVGGVVEGMADGVVAVVAGHRALLELLDLRHRKLRAGVDVGDLGAVGLLHLDPRNLAALGIGRSEGDFVLDVPVDALGVALADGIHAGVQDDLRARFAALRVGAVVDLHGDAVVVLHGRVVAALAGLARGPQRPGSDGPLVADDHAPQFLGVRGLQRHQVQGRIAAHVALDAVHPRVRAQLVRRDLLGVHRVAHRRAERVAVGVFPARDAGGTHDSQPDDGQHRRGDRSEHQRPATQANFHGSAFLPVVPLRRVCDPATAIAARYQRGRTSRPRSANCKPAGPYVIMLKTIMMTVTVPSSTAVPPTR